MIESSAVEAPRVRVLAGPEQGLWMETGVEPIYDRELIEAGSSRLAKLKSAVT
jgi:hypothetical protein